MKQQTLAMAGNAQSGFERHRKPTKRDEFLKTMETLMPWSALFAEIGPHYPKAGNGRPPNWTGCCRGTCRTCLRGRLTLEGFQLFWWSLDHGFGKKFA